MTWLSPYWPKGTKKSMWQTNQPLISKHTVVLASLGHFQRSFAAKWHVVLTLHRTKKHNTKSKTLWISKEVFGRRFCGIINSERFGSCGAGPNLCRMGWETKQTELFFLMKTSNQLTIGICLVRPCACSSPEHVNRTGSKCHAQCCVRVRTAMNPHFLNAKKQTSGNVFAKYSCDGEREFAEAWIKVVGHHRAHPCHLQRQCAVGFIVQIVWVWCGYGSGYGGGYGPNKTWPTCKFGLSTRSKKRTPTRSVQCAFPIIESE